MMNQRMVIHSLVLLFTTGSSILVEDRDDPCGAYSREEACHEIIDDTEYLYCVGSYAYAKGDLECMAKIISTDRVDLGKFMAPTKLHVLHEPEPREWITEPPTESPTETPSMEIMTDGEDEASPFKRNRYEDRDTEKRSADPTSESYGDLEKSGKAPEIQAWQKALVLVACILLSMWNII